MLILRICNSDGSSPSPDAKGFKWPLAEGARVEAPDWDPTPGCGHGLHGWAWGQGSAIHAGVNNVSGKVWLVFETPDEEVVTLNDKVKAPFGVVKFFGSQKEVTDRLISLTPGGKTGPVIGASLVVGDQQGVSVGDWGTATAGDRGTATAGNFGTATAGDRGTASAGFRGRATAGDHGTASAGFRGRATAGDYGAASAGDDGTALAGNWGTATAGDYGTASAGDHGTASARNYGKANAGFCGKASAGVGGTATAGIGGTCSAGVQGIISISYYHDNTRRRLLTGHIGEDGLEPGVLYKIGLSPEGKAQFVKS